MSLADCSGRRVHKIDPYMVTYYGCIRVDFYVCGHGLSTSLADCSGRRVHKINPLIWWYACYYIRVDFYVLYIRLTLIV